MVAGLNCFLATTLRQLRYPFRSAASNFARDAYAVAVMVSGLQVDGRMPGEELAYGMPGRNRVDGRGRGCSTQRRFNELGRCVCQDEPERQFVLPDFTRGIQGFDEQVGPADVDFVLEGLWRSTFEALFDFRKSPGRLFRFRLW